ncbi:hypothetical protein M9Y10_001452 [Tritrichomonas musculus]|uniref:Surface antigen BspA-like n=1 Tax=Tritrichomonas musculus TaxID=1915356 RepID=A0ABR2LA54_9EUKA
MGSSNSISYTSKNGINFLLDKKQLVAEVSSSPTATGDFFFKHSIRYHSQDYIIKSIESRSFIDNKQIKSIEFPQNSELELIGDEAFKKSSLESIFIPSKIIQIGPCTFSECKNLKRVKFANDSLLQSIGQYSFAFTAIETITLPAHIKEIGEFSFHNCSKLKEVKIDASSEFLTINGYAFAMSNVKKISIPAKIKELKEGWCRCTNKLTEISIHPNNRKFSFFDEEKKLIISKSDEDNDEFDIAIFACRDIETVFIPTSIKNISSFSFEQCKKLKKIEFSENSQIKTIQKYAFSMTSIEKICFPKSLEVIEDGAFFFCANLKEIEFSKDSKLVSIRQEAFSFTSIASLSIPPHVKSIGIKAFYLNASLKTIFIPENSELESVGSEAFNKSSLERIVLPASLKRIERMAFYDCSCLKSVEYIGEQLLIMSGSFASCRSLFVLSFPNASKVTFNSNEKFSKNCSLFFQPKTIIEITT